MSGFNDLGGYHQQRWRIEMKGHDLCRDPENIRQKERIQR